MARRAQPSASATRRDGARYYEDLSEFDIAEALGMAPGTVKSNAHAAQRRLADILGEPTVETVEGVQP